MRTTSSGVVLERRILAVLEVGPRPPQWFRWMATTKTEYERAIGSLALRGMVLFKGRTSGRVMAINGRRRKGGA